MIVEKPIQVLFLRCLFRLARQLLQLRDLFLVCVLSNKCEGERFQFDAYVKNLLRIFKTELGYLSARKRRTQNESVMFEFDQGLTDQSLSHAELLRELPLDNLFAGLDCSRQDGFFQQCYNARLFGNRLNLLKSCAHVVAL